MTPISVKEAKTRLDDLIHQAAQRQEVIISDSAGTAVRLVPVDAPARPRFGSARGMFTIANDFDAPLEEFAPYEQ